MEVTREAGFVGNRRVCARLVEAIPSRRGPFPPVQAPADFPDEHAAEATVRL
jgi:hypothetical protein